jgi:hypothetical protein
MPETDDQRDGRFLRELEGKNAAFYSVMLQSWLDTRMEKDRTLVTLSAAGIGLLITILTTAGVKYYWELSLYLGAAAGFGFSIWTNLKIFEINARHIEKVIRGTESSSPTLEHHDKLALRGFMPGTAFFIALGVSASIGQLHDKRATAMENSEKALLSTGVQSVKLNSPTAPAGNQSSVQERRSFNGVGVLRPESTQTPVKPSTQPENSQTTTQQAVPTSQPSNTEAMGTSTD